MKSDRTCFDCCDILIRATVGVYVYCLQGRVIPLLEGSLLWVFLSAQQSVNSCKSGFVWHAIGLRSMIQEYKEYDTVSGSTGLMVFECVIVIRWLAGSFEHCGRK